MFRDVTQNNTHQFSSFTYWFSSLALEFNQCQQDSSLPGSVKEEHLALYASKDYTNQSMLIPTSSADGGMRCGELQKALV